MSENKRYSVYSHRQSSQHGTEHDHSLDPNSRKNRWPLVHVLFSIVMGMIGLCLFIISVHIQIEPGINGVRRFGAVVLSLCAISYVTSISIAIWKRNSPRIETYLTLWIAITCGIQILVLGIAKGTLSQIHGYNIAAGLFTGFAAVVDLGLMLIQYGWGVEHM